MKRTKFRKLLEGRRALLERAMGTMQERGLRPCLIIDWMRRIHGFDFLVDQGSDKESPTLVCVMERAVEPSRYEMFLKHETKRIKELWFLHFYDEKKNDPGRFLVYRFEGSKLISEPKDWPLKKVVKSFGKKKDPENEDQVQEN